MALAKALVVAFTNNPLRSVLICCHNNSPHHRVGLRILTSVGSQLQATVHVLLVFLLLIHGVKDVFSPLTA